MRTTNKAFEERHAEELARLENEKAAQELQNAGKTDYLADYKWENRYQAGLEERRALDPTFEAQEGLEKYAPWMPEVHNPILLRMKPLSELGSPYETYGSGRLPSVSRWFDYRDLGWPKSAGPSWRHSTPEEYQEIIWRLEKTVGLTLPGSEVPNVRYTLREILEMPLKQPQWIVEGLLREGGAAMIYAPPGVGKTWFAMTLALLAAHGKGLEACEVLKAGPGPGVKTLVVDGEMLVFDLQARATGLLMALGTYEPEVCDRLEYYPKTEKDPRTAFLDLGDPAWLEELVRTVERGEYRVVILDNLSTLSPSLEDENSAAAWAPLNEIVVALKHLGVAVVLVHHTGKGTTKGASYRGSSNLMTTLETAISLERVEESLEDHGSNARFRVVLEKHRNHGMPEVNRKVLKLEGFGWVVDVDEFAETETLVNKAKSLRYATQEELGKAMGFPQYRVSRILKKAVAQKLCTAEQFREWLETARGLRENPDVDLDI